MALTQYSPASTAIAAGSWLASGNVMVTSCFARRLALLCTTSTTCMLLSSVGLPGGQAVQCSTRRHCPRTTV